MPIDIYSPTDGTASNKPFSLRGKPSVGRRYYYDRSGTFRYRQFISHEEACLTLPLEDDRRGHEPLIINTGGAVGSDGYITGGTDAEYWWTNNDYSDEGLILKVPSVDLSDYYTKEQINELIGDGLPEGLQGQIIKVAESGTNDYVVGDMISFGNYINTEEELQDAISTFQTQEEIFNTWPRFSHGLNNIASTSIPGFPADTDEWLYDSFNNLVKCTSNTTSLTGFISNKKLNKYSINATLGSTANDNDFIAIIIAYVEDINDQVANNAFGMNPADFDWDIDVTSPTIPNQHTITLLRGRTDQSIFGIGSVLCRYALVYNYRKTDERILTNGDSLVFNTNNSFAGSNNCDIRVEKADNIIKAMTTNWSDAPGGKGDLGFELTYDLSSNADTEKFITQTNYGFGALSQDQSFFKNLIIDDGNNAPIYDLRSDEVWIANPVTGYAIATDVTFISSIKRNWVGNRSTLKSFYIDDESDVFKVESKSSEKIAFTSSTGVQTIDFLLNNRNVLFPSPNIRAYNISGSTQTEIKGFSSTFTLSGTLITSLEIDGIFGNGYIILSN